MSRAAGIRLQRAERKAGQLLRDREKAKPPGDNQYGKADRFRHGTEAKTLSDLGVSKRHPIGKNSPRFQRTAQ